MAHRLTRKHLAAPLGVAALALTTLAQPALASSHLISSGHWDLVAEVDCSANTVELFAENHGADPAVVRNLADVVFVVNDSSDDELVNSDRSRFDPDPVRALSHDENEAAPNGKLVLGFEVEYAGCNTATPDVTFKVVSGSTGPRAAAYKNSNGTSTSLDTAVGSGLNGGVTTDTHEDRRWGFSTADDYGVRVEAKVDPGSGDVTDTETVTFDVV